MSPYKALSEILRKAQGLTDAETGKEIDVGAEVAALRDHLRTANWIEDRGGLDVYACHVFREGYMSPESDKIIDAPSLTPSLAAWLDHRNYLLPEWMKKDNTT